MEHPIKTIFKALAIVILLFVLSQIKLAFQESEWFLLIGSFVFILIALLLQMVQTSQRLAKASKVSSTNYSLKKTNQQS